MRSTGPRAAAAAIVAATLATVATPAHAFEARGSAEQVWATGLTPGAKVTVTDAAGHRVAQRKVNALGGTLFRDVRPGEGYRLASGAVRSGPLTVLTNNPTPPDQGSYDQTIPADGYGYMRMRDGTQLAYSVHPPNDFLNALGVNLPTPPVNPPYPTLIEYAGYGYADPKGPQSGIAAVANLMGFAVVDVNMRGTGCSGGAFDFFEPLQSLDGYDIIETVARQPWVKGHRVGMFGISYGGISQLFTASTRPPSLAAIAPLSVIDATQTTLYPGGILNTGFSFEWAKERVHDALPSGPKAGQAYAARQIAAGDATCKANQALHPEAADLVKKVRENDHYVPKVADPLAPVTFVDRIDVPVYMACQFTDEQTGGHCPTLANRLTGTDRRWVTFTNGTHVDSLDPETYNRMFDFLSLYVARQAPALWSPVVQLSAPLVFQAAFGIDGVTLPPDPIQQIPTYDAAKEAFEKLPPVRVLFDNGAGSEDPGHPYPGFERSFASFPPPGTAARAWYLEAGGGLTDGKPRRSGVARFTWDPRARPLTNFTGDTASGKNGLWTATPPYKWTQDPPGTAVAFVTPPLDRDTVVAGAGAVTAWVRTKARSVDLQATISEVRPDGRETFVQGGWLRTEGRKLDAKRSTPLEPMPSFRTRDISPMPRGRFAKVTIPLYYEAHAYRKASRIRVRISAPNGDQPIWAFAETKPKGRTLVDIATGASRPSRLLLPVTPGIEIPTSLPPCPGLRGEPCREYKALTNGRARR